VYGKTLNRPEFREWSPTLYYDFDLLALSHGTLSPTVDNPKGFVLKTATIDNYDIRYEWYPGENQTMNAGIFYKKFINPIEQISEDVLHRTGVSREITFQNSASAYCLGAEIEIRGNLKFIGDRVGLSWFQNMNFIGNCALIKSQVSNSNDTLIRPRALQGQAPYLVNLSLYYANPLSKLEVMVSYNVIGPRIFLAGGTDGPHTPSGPSVGELPRHVFDFTLSEKLTPHIILNFGVQDLLNQRVIFVEDTNRDGKFQPNNGDRIFMSYHRGSYYSLGVRIKL